MNEQNTGAVCATRDATCAELERQLEAARAEQEKAKTVHATAERAFDDARDSKALAKADEALDRAVENMHRTERLVARAQRLLDDARSRDEAQHRAELEAKRAELESELTEEAMDAAAAKLIETEVGAFVMIAKARQHRIELELEFGAKARELYRVRKLLGCSPEEGIHMDGEGRMRTGTRGVPSTGRILNMKPVKDALTEQAAGALRSDPILSALVRAIESTMRDQHTIAP